MALEPIRKRGYSTTAQASLEAKAIESAETDTERHLADYIDDSRSFNGKYVAADLMKETFDFYSESNEARTLANGPVHNSATVLAAELYRRNLTSPDISGNTVVFLTGVPGAGKTSSIVSEGSLPDEVRMVFEGQLSNPESGIEKIRLALAAGLDARILAVHTTPEIALRNTFTRFDDIGRGAGIGLMADIMAKLPGALKTILNEFGDKVSFTIIDRRNNPIKIYNGTNNLSILESEGDYDSIKNRLESTALAYRQQGRINDQAYRQATGRDYNGIVSNQSLAGNVSGQLGQDGQQSTIPRNNSQENFVTPLSVQDESRKLEFDALSTEYSQNALIQSAPPDQQYQSGLQTYVLEKQEQVERIEERLQSLINQQQIIIKQTELNQPGLLGRLTGAGRRWQNVHDAQLNRLTTLQARLEVVSELHTGTIATSPRLEELADRKLRNNQPDLAKVYDLYMEQQRKEILKDKLDQKTQQNRSNGRSRSNE